MGNWKTYKNGNYTVRINLDNGTRIRETENDEFIPAFAENMDIKICNRCDMACPFCHEGSTSDGKLGDILNEKFIDTLKPYQEVALGGGNVFEHPDLIPFLERLKEKKVIPNITLHQVHFERNIDKVRYLVDNKLVYGIGVSLTNPTEQFINLVKEFSNVVIHTINGLLTKENITKMANNDLKILILGYKELRRGNDFLEENRERVIKNQEWLRENLVNMFDKFKVVSFDNLAIEQLEVRRLLSDEEWERFYAGDEGSSTFYIDMVERKFAKNSIAPFDERYELLDSVVDMFNVIRSH